MLSSGSFPQGQGRFWGSTPRWHPCPSYRRRAALWAGEKPVAGREFKIRRIPSARASAPTEPVSDEISDGQESPVAHCVSLAGAESPHYVADDMDLRITVECGDGAGPIQGLKPRACGTAGECLCHVPRRSASAICFSEIGTESLCCLEPLRQSFYDRACGDEHRMESRTLTNAFG